MKILGKMCLLGKIVCGSSSVLKLASSFLVEVPQRKTQSGCFDLDSSLLQLKCLSARRYVLFTRNIENFEGGIMYIYIYMQKQSLLAKTKNAFKRTFFWYKAQQLRCPGSFQVSTALGHNHGMRAAGRMNSVPGRSRYAVRYTWVFRQKS